jgi:DNA repair protein RecO (recombination protein O)
MLIKTRAVVLDVTPYSEASIILKAYTAEHGLQSFLVNGVRKQKARFAANLFQPLTLLEIVAYHRKSGGLHRVAEVNLSPPLVHIPYDTVKTTIALFLAELIYRSVREEERNPELFGFIDHSVQMLDLHPHTASRFHLVFALQLTRYLGFFPGGSYGAHAPFFDLREGLFCEMRPPHPYVLDPEAAARLYALLQVDLDGVDGIALSAAERKSLLDAIILYYELHHTQGFSIRSHGVLSELMA